MSRAGWDSKGQQRQVDSVQNQLNRLVKVGRMQPVPLTGLSATSDLKTRGAQVSFKVVALEGIESFVLLRNFSRDPGSAQQIHVWATAALKATPQTFPLNLQHTDADPAIAGQKAYYWLKAVPVSNKTAGNAFLSGPQLFDASNLPNAKQIAGDFAAYQAYTPTTAPLSAATGVLANHAVISIASFQIQYPFDANGDGLPDLVSYSSGSLGPLLDNTTYFVYFDDPTYTGGAQTYIATTQNPDLSAGLHRQYVGQVKTPAFGGGGTIGFGGGGGACFSGNTRVQVKRGHRKRGKSLLLPIAQVEAGDRVLTRRGWRLVKQRLEHAYDGVMHEMGSGELVTPGHRMRAQNDAAQNGWVAAKTLFPASLAFKGPVYNLEISCAADAPDDVHCYRLGNGLYAHNVNKPSQP